MTTISTRAGQRKRTATNTKIEWQEKGLRPRQDAINKAAGYDDNDVDLEVDNVNYFRKYDLVKNLRTGEVMRVTAEPATAGANLLTVVRSWGSTAAAAILDNDPLLIVASAWPENSPKGKPSSHVEAQPYNFTEIFRTSFGESRTQQNVDSYSGGRKEARRDHGVEHRIAMEHAWLYGERNEDVSVPEFPVRSAGGLFEYLTSNIKDAGGGLTWAEVEDWFEMLFTHTGGSNTRLVLAAGKVCSVLDLIAVEKMQVVPKEDTFGVSIRQLVTSHGNALVTKHHLLSYGAYANMAIGIEPSKIKYAPLQNSDTKLIPDIQDRGDDGWQDEYLTEASLEIANPELHGILKNVTGVG